MLDGGELDLESGFSALGVFFKNFQNQIDPISSDHFVFEVLFFTHEAEFLVDGVNLCGLERVSDHQEVGVEPEHISDDFLELSFSYIGPEVRMIFFLVFLEDDYSSVGIDEVFELSHSIIEDFFFGLLVYQIYKEDAKFWLVFYVHFSLHKGIKTIASLRAKSSDLLVKSKEKSDF